MNCQVAEIATSIIQIYTHKFTSKHTNTCMRTHTRARAHTHTCTDAATHARTHKHKRTQRRANTDTHTHTYTHTHTHTHTLTHTDIYTGTPAHSRERCSYNFFTYTSLVPPHSSPLSPTHNPQPIPTPPPPRTIPLLSAKDEPLTIASPDTKDGETKRARCTGINRQRLTIRLTNYLQGRYAQVEVIWS
jgi:hypothetical protein